MDALERLTLEVCEDYKTIIADANGAEVLIIGHLDEHQKVWSFEVVSRGHDSAAPAIFEMMEKGDVVIHNHPSGRLQPSQADLNIASRIGNLGIGFYIVDNSVTSIYVVCEPIPVWDKQELDSVDVMQYLAPNGPLSRCIPDYEPRESQIQMLKHIVDSLNNDRIAVIEAGTGVGKSFAYLIPAIHFAELNNERIVISTGTINLQQQLLDKDIPTVQKLLKTKVKSVLVKGRGNYLCLRRLAESLEEDALFREEEDQLNSLREWALSSQTGDRTDVSFYPDAQLWSKVNSEADSCLGLRCTFRERCFVLKARREAASARILVVNHHLLFADLSMRLGGAGFDNTAVLPPFQRIIFDEAHNIEKSATSYFSELLNRFSLFRQLNRLVQKKRGRTVGIFQQLCHVADIGPHVYEIPEQVEQVREAMNVLDSVALTVLDNSYTLRLKDADETVLDLLKDPVFELQNRLFLLLSTIGQTLEPVSDKDLEDNAVFETRIIKGRLEAFAAILQSFQNFDEHEKKVFWLEKKKTSLGDMFVQFIITPLDIRSMMQSSVFEPYATVVCTSATLTVNNQFVYFLNRVGLQGYDKQRLLTKSLPSPFPYRERVLLSALQDQIIPGHPDFQAMAEEIIRDILVISEGRALVLFTSYVMLSKTYEFIKPEMDRQKISLLKQGEDDRSRLLERFNTDTASVLLATDSFWEGVDAPGETLQTVIICRLPFRVPTDPVVKARMELIESRGANPFMEMSLPEAVMKFKQGFGRLMRKHSDRGAVVILDTRLLNKYYGKLFINSLPETRYSFGGKEQLLRDLETFLYEEK